MNLALIVADSISTAGSRITTMEWDYQRFIHSEVMTHRSHSKNAASSRAIPINTTIGLITENPAMPVFWGKNQAGMSAKEELGEQEIRIAKSIWLDARDKAIVSARQLASLGLHKQIVNRLLEPWAHIKVVITATDDGWANLFTLRRHPDAQPEFQAQANEAWEAYSNSKPLLRRPGEWHLPYVDHETLVQIGLENSIKLSASLCAQTSYRKADDSIEKALDLYDRLVLQRPVHASPFEHHATPLDNAEEKSGNLTGWHQNRQSIPYNVSTVYTP